MPIAQINVARMIAPFESETMKEFRDFIDPINKLAESSPGFIWRFTNEHGDEDLHFPDEYIVVNMSVWESHEALHEFVYKTVHSYFIKSRKRWFHQLGHPHTALWWVDEGEIPDLSDGKKRLALLESKGPTAEAFTFAKLMGTPR